MADPKTLWDNLVIRLLTVYGWWLNLEWTWPWVSEYVLNLLSISACFVSLVEIFELTKRKKDDKAWAAFFLLWFCFVVIVLGSIWLLVSQVYVRWIRAISNKLNKWKWGERLPRWFICNASMNMVIWLVKLNPVLHLVLAGSFAVSTVAMLSRAHRRRDPSGLTEGICTCFLICFLTFLEVVVLEDKNEGSSQPQCCTEDTRKGQHAITSAVTAFLCLLCSILPAPAQDEVPPPPPPPPAHFQNLQDQISSLQEQFNIFRSTVPGSSHDVPESSVPENNFEEQLNAMTLESQLLKAEISNLLQQKYSMEGDICNLNIALQEMRSKENTLCGQLKKLEYTNNSAVAEIKSLVESGEVLNTQVRNLQLKVVSLSNEKDGLEETLKAISQEYILLREENSELQGQRTTLQQEVSALNHKLRMKEESTLMHQTKSLQEDLTTGTSAVETVVENKQDVQASLHRFEKEKLVTSEVQSPSPCKELKIQLSKVRSETKEATSQPQACSRSAPAPPSKLPPRKAVVAKPPFKI